MVRHQAGITQLVEYQLPKLRVAGSSPVSRSDEASGPQRLLSLTNAFASQLALAKHCLTRDRLTHGYSSHTRPTSSRGLHEQF